MYNYDKQSIVNIINLSNSVLRSENDKNNLCLPFCLFYQDKIKIPFENYKESSFLYLNNENLSNKQLKNFNEDLDDNENTEFSINEDSENNKSIEKLLNIYRNNLKQINELKEDLKSKKRINQNKIYRNQTPFKNTGIQNNDFINNDKNNKFDRNSKSYNNIFYDNESIDGKNKKKNNIMKEKERLINIIAKKFPNFDKNKKKRNKKRIKEKQQKVITIDYKFDFDSIRGKKKDESTNLNNNINKINK